METSGCSRPFSLHDDLGLQQQLWLTYSGPYLALKQFKETLNMWRLSRLRKSEAFAAVYVRGRGRVRKRAESCVVRTLGTSSSLLGDNVPVERLREHYASLARMTDAVDPLLEWANAESFYGNVSEARKLYRVASRRSATDPALVSFCLDIAHLSRSISRSLGRWRPNTTQAHSVQLLLNAVAGLG